MHEVDVLVVGAGPGGLAAAASAADAGASVVVVDEQSVPGGQFLRPRVGVTHPAVGRFLARGIDVALGESVWFVDAAERVVRTERLELRYGSLVVAAGAYDRPVAVAGGALPGVLTAGAAQALAKDGVRLGDAVLVVGSGPFAFPVSAEVLCAGARVVEVALSRVPWLGTGPLHAPGVVGEMLRYGHVLARHRVPLRTGWLLDRVVGTDRVEGAVLTGRGGRRREVACDTVAYGYGFLPQLAVADLAGCLVRYDPLHRTWFVAVDPADLATSVPGVYAAGEVTGIGGHRKAVAEGEVAGRSAARHAGHAAPGGVRRLRRATRFAAAAQRALAPPTPAVPDDAVVCRCEDVTAGAVRSAARDGAVTVSGVRMRTRCGMGPCQGRMCAQLCGELVDSAREQPPGTAGRLASRVPLRPTTMRQLVP